MDFGTSFGGIDQPRSDDRLTRRTALIMIIFVLALIAGSRNWSIIESSCCLCAAFEYRSGWRASPSFWWRLRKFAHPVATLRRISSSMVHEAMVLEYSGAIWL